MLIGLTQHTTRCITRTGKAQEHMIAGHATVEAEAEPGLGKRNRDCQLASPAPMLAIVADADNIAILQP